MINFKTNSNLKKTILRALSTKSEKTKKTILKSEKLILIKRLKNT